MKQSTRIKLLALFFLTSGLGAVFVLFKNSPFVGGGDTAIKISLDSATISKVTLQYDGKTTVISKGLNNWQVNNKFRARPNLVQLMVVGLSKTVVKRQVAKENKAKVIDYLNKKGILVNVDGVEWQKSFKISSNENDDNSSYYMETGSSEPYIVYVPGFSSNMANLFKQTEAEWRSKELFISTPMSLKEINVSYPAFKSSSIAIKWNTDKTFKIEGVTRIDTSKVITYLSQFEQVNVDNYLYKDKENLLVSLRKNKPQAVIEVTDLNLAGNHKLSIYEACKEPKGIYAIVEPENEVVTMNPETLFRILVRKEFFEKK